MIIDSFKTNVGFKAGAAYQPGHFFKGMTIIIRPSFILQ